MITQALIDYIQTQQSAGVPREKITAALLAQGGWTPEQVQEAFQQASHPAVPRDVGAKVDVWARIQKYNKRTFIGWILLIGYIVALVRRFKSGVPI
jgi:hypothetical protein